MMSQKLNQADYAQALGEASNIVLNRGAEEGRNLARDFWDTFPHGLSDMTFMVRDKADRILGAEAKNRLDIIRDNALDIINYAAFIVMWIDNHSKDSDSVVCPRCRVEELKTRFTNHKGVDMAIDFCQHCGYEHGRLI